MSVVHIKASGVKLAIVWGIQLEATDLILEPSSFDYVYFHMVTLSCVCASSLWLICQPSPGLILP